ncbi:mitochondrial ribosomal protein L52 [Carabus blaptoides fortunei]
MYEPVLFACGQIFGNVSRVQICSISTSGARNLIQAYRKQKGQPMNPNSYGPLTDLPDFTYLDGRSTPLGMRQKKRMLKQKEIAQTILTLSKEIDFAVKRHEDMVTTEKENAEKILANKLKPKGHLLLKDKNWSIEFVEIFPLGGVFSREPKYVRCRPYLLHCTAGSSTEGRASGNRAVVIDQTVPTIFI